MGGIGLTRLRRYEPTENENTEPDERTAAQDRGLDLLSNTVHAISRASMHK